MGVGGCGIGLWFWMGHGKSREKGYEKESFWEMRVLGRPEESDHNQGHLRHLTTCSCTGLQGRSEKISQQAVTKKRTNVVRTWKVV